MIGSCKIFYASFIELLVLFYFLYRHFMRSDPTYPTPHTYNVEETKELYFPLLKAYIHSLMLNNLTEEEFYQKLYNTVFQSEIFPQDEKKQAILLCFLSEETPRIPYFQAMNLLKMTSDEYKEAIQHLKPQIEKAIDILNRSFKSRTEEASQIYEIMSSLKTRSDKIVFLAVYTNIIQNNTKQQLKRT